MPELALRCEVSGEGRMMQELADMARLVRRHAGEGPSRTAIANLDLYCGSKTAIPVDAIADPSWCVPALCVVIQGRKRATIGKDRLVFGESSYVVTALPLPITGALFEADGDRPFLGLRLRLDLALLNDLLAEMPVGSVGIDAIEQEMPNRLPVPLAGGLLRLLHLIDEPADAAILAPSVEREISYRLLRSGHGELLRRIASPDDRLLQIKLSIDWVRQHYSERLSIGRMAEVARMSCSSFHHHFKMVTATSPLQFQKLLRLAEARRLIRSEQLNAATAGFRVGYESASQFNREYKRLFGKPPARDAAGSPGAVQRTGDAGPRLAGPSPRRAAAAICN